MERETKPTLRNKLGALSRNLPFPIGLAMVAIGAGLIYLPAGVIVGGIAAMIVGWAVEE